VDSTGLTPDGFAAYCVPGIQSCSYFAPGPERRGGPVVTTADLSLWGLGIEGLRVRATGRLGVALGDEVWPGTNPAAQLLEAYAEYARERFTIQLGRTHRTGRFGWTGFDGAAGSFRATSRLAVSAWGGWGLARGVALPVTSPALNPLDDFQPRDRQLVAGADAVIRLPWLTGRILYQREVDPGIDAFVSERAGMDVTLDLPAGLSLAAGGDYDLASGWAGSGEITARYLAPGGLVNVALGARRYRPHFPLWTIWGAFSPVPYRAASGTAALRPLDGLELRVSGEVYGYDAAHAATPLTDVEQDGWRWNWGASWQPLAPLMLDAGFHAEFGPGGSSRGLQASVTWLPRAGMWLTAHAAQLLRPLEFRFSEADVWVLGLDAAAEVTSRVRVNVSAVRYDEARNRPDAGGFEWDQFRLSAGLRLVLGQAFDRADLPPAILRIPEGSR
jgi:hypothetical protein